MKKGKNKHAWEGFPFRTISLVASGGRRFITNVSYVVAITRLSAYVRTLLRLSKALGKNSR